MFKAVRVLTRMCPCADSYEPSLLERNIRLLKIVILLFFSFRFYFSADFLSRFKAVRVLARMCPCADSYEPSLLERNIKLLKIVIFLFFSVRFYFSTHFFIPFQSSEGSSENASMPRLIWNFAACVIVRYSVHNPLKCGSRGGTGGPDPPLENHKLYGFL